MLEKLVGVLLVVALLVGIIILVSNNLNARFDEFGPKGVEPPVLVWPVAIALIVVALLVGGILTVIGGKHGGG